MEAKKKLNEVMDNDKMFERFKKFNAFLHDKEAADFMGQSAQSLNNKKMSGTIWKDLLIWAINENIDLNWFLKGQSTYINGYIGNNVINNGSSNHVDMTNTVTKGNEKKLMINEKLDHTQKLAKLKEQGLMTDAQYQKAMDELWGVVSGTAPETKNPEPVDPVRG